jgi:hypothetical protein
MKLINITIAIFLLSVCFAPLLIGEDLPRRSDAKFVRIDTKTQGNWKGAYGAEGYDIAEHTENYPSYVKVSAHERLREIWSPLTKDPRALLKKNSDKDRFIARWYRWSNDEWTLIFQFADQNLHQLAVYCVDWDRAEPREQKIEVMDTFSQKVLDTQIVSSFAEGKYLVWNVKGAVTLKFSCLKGDGSVMSGLFFDRPAASSVREK